MKIKVDINPNNIMVICCMTIMGILLSCKSVENYTLLQQVPEGYFDGAKKIIFLSNGKEITDQDYISNIFKHFDLSDRRVEYAAYIPLFIQVTLKDDKNVLIGINPISWWFENNSIGNIRDIKDPIVFYKLFYDLSEKYGPFSK